MENSTLLIEKGPSSQQYFFVFQNKSFNAEMQGGYLWAPKLNKNCHTFHHWKRMEEVKKGDVIFHSVNKKIIAISVAITDCYSANQPEELKREQLWDNDGWRVDSKYYIITNPIITSDYMDKIKELQPNKYAPFNDIGRGNAGYLFLSNYNLSKFLFDKLLLNNTYIKSIATQIGIDK